MKPSAQILISMAVIFLCTAIMVSEGKETIETKKETTVSLPPLTMVDKNSPPSIQMAYYIQKYANEYDVPINYAFGVAYVETRYEGPYQWSYNPHQVSCAGAVGPMQIMPATGRGNWKDRTVTREMLLNDIEFNVHTSMKVLHKLYDKYGNWKTVFGCYNTGRPCVNDYAIKVYNFKPGV
jgi:hypothetical protein